MTMVERTAEKAGDEGRFYKDSRIYDNGDDGSYDEVESVSDEDESYYGEDDGDYDNGDDDPSSAAFSFRYAVEEQRKNDDEYSSSFYSSSSEEIVGYSSTEVGMDSSGHRTPTSGTALSEEPLKQPQQIKSSVRSPSKSTSRTMLVSDSEGSSFSDRSDVENSYDDDEDDSFYESEENSSSHSNAHSTKDKYANTDDVNGDSGDTSESFGAGSFPQSSFQWSSFDVNNGKKDDVNASIGVDDKDVDDENDDNGEEVDNAFAMFGAIEDTTAVETGSNPQVSDDGKRNSHVADAFGIDPFADSNRSGDSSFAQEFSDASGDSDTVLEPIRDNSKHENDNELKGDGDYDHDDDDKWLSSSSSIVVCDVAAEMVATATMEAPRASGQNEKDVHQSSSSSWNVSFSEGSETHESSFSMPSPLSKPRNFNHDDDNINLPPIHDRTYESEEESATSSHNDSSFSLYYKTERLPTIRDESEEDSAMSSRRNTSFSSYSEKQKNGTANDSSSNNDSFTGLAMESHRTNAYINDTNEKSSENKIGNQNDGSWNASFGDNSEPPHLLSRTDVESSSYSHSSLKERVDNEQVFSLNIDDVELLAQSEEQHQSFTTDNINTNDDRFTAESIHDSINRSSASTTKQALERSGPRSNGELEDGRSSSSSRKSTKDNSSNHRSSSNSLVDREAENDSTSLSPSNTNRSSHSSGLSAEKAKDSNAFSFHASFNSETFHNNGASEESSTSNRNGSNRSRSKSPIEDASPFLNSNDSSFHTMEFSEDQIKKQPFSPSLYPPFENNIESQNAEFAGESSWNPVFDDNHQKSQVRSPNEEIGQSQSGNDSVDPSNHDRSIGKEGQSRSPEDGTGGDDDVSWHSSVESDGSDDHFDSKKSNQEAVEVSSSDSTSSFREAIEESFVSPSSNTAFENFEQPGQEKSHNDDADEGSSASDQFANSKPDFSPTEANDIDEDHSFYSSSESRSSSSKRGIDVDESWNSSHDGSRSEVSDPDSVFDSDELAKSLKEYPDQFSHASSVGKSRTNSHAEGSSHQDEEAKMEELNPNFDDGVDEASTSVVSHEEYEAAQVSVTSLYSSEYSDVKSFEDDADDTPVVQKATISKNENNSDPLLLRRDLKMLESAEASETSGSQREQSLFLKNTKLSTFRTAESDENNEDSAVRNHGDQNDSGEDPAAAITKVPDSRNRLQSISELHISVHGAPHEASLISTSEQLKVQGNNNEPIQDNSDRGEGSEASMMIGDVFGQPNELFDDYQRSSLENSSRNAGNSTVNIGSKSNLIESSSKTGDQSFDDSNSTESQNQPLSEGIAVNGDGKQKKKKKILSEKERRRRKKRKKERRRRKKEAKSPALLDFAANVNETILDLEDRSEPIDENDESSANSLLHGFDALLGIFLQLSDELELIVVFSESKNKKDQASVVHVGALTAILAFAETFDQLFSDLKPIILNSFEEEPDDYMVVLFERLDCLVDLLCETTHRVGERQEWNCRSETTYVTLLEMIERDSLDLRCYFDDVTTPDPGISANVYEAWSATGHTEELKALQRNSDPQIFRQICYEVMVSTDQWCPDTDMLMEICDIDPQMLSEDPLQEVIDESELAPVPQAAENILDKVNGDTLRRLDVFASILRRILPPRAVTDVSLLSYFTSIRHTLDSPLELSATNIVSISSIPESMNDPDALGVAGVGKTTLAAMVAKHPDVRRYFIDGVVWVYIGDEELNYKRYTQCLRELVAQLDFYDGIPLFAELLHTPGENLSKRRRREEGFMIYARDTIAGLLENRSVLIILDDVCFEPDMDWFDFAPMTDESIQSQRDNCALVVTTRCRSLLPAADTVEIDMLNEADAITLLIQESGQLSHTLMAESVEARSLVKECANHPLAVKSVGRWLNLKHATAGVVNSVEEIHSEVIKSMDRILKTGENTGTDMMYEILSTSLSPAINGGPTNIIKFCFAAFIMVFCDRNHISEFLLIEQAPIIPMDIAELLFQTLLEMYEVSLLKKGSLFYAQKKEAAVLIPEALSALGVLKVITYSDNEDEEDLEDEQKFVQVMHSIHHEYGEYLAHDDPTLKDFTKDAERQWNRALVDAYLSRVGEWDWELEDAAHCYALEMIVSHMIRGSMYNVAANLLAEKSFIRGRLRSLGRENCTRRHIKDCEMLCRKLRERKSRDKKLKPLKVMKNAYRALGRELTINVEKKAEQLRVKNVEIARAHYEIGFSLAENRCWDAAIVHWDISQELLVSVLGSVEVVAGILYNIGVVHMELNEYELALNVLKKCLKIRGSIHGEEHVLYAQTIQKIGDVFLNMSDYHEALESYNWALDVMYKEPDHHFIQIGEILDKKGTIHYSKGEVDEALQCHQEALRSKQEDLGEDHPELASTYHHIGNCLSDQGNIEDAIVHFDEAIRLKELDPEGGPEIDADVLTIEGILHNLEGNQELGLECYERSLQILVTKVPYRKEKIASLLHFIGCVYLMGGEQKKAMKLFQESLQARRKVLGFVHLDVASTLFNMAFLHQTRNHLDKALQCLEEALKIRQLRLPKSEKVAVTHEKIGSLARVIGKAKKAQIAFEEALVIRKAIHGEQHETVATVLQELGELMGDLGEYEAAMSYFIEALEIRRDRLGADDVYVAETLYSMGYTMQNSNDPDRALVCLVEALSIRRFQLGEDSVEVGDTLNMMGFLKAKRGELDDALNLLWDALRIRKLQEDLIKVSETLKNIGNVHRKKDELELALECYAECLRIRRTELDLDHEKVADVLMDMGEANGQQKRDDEATELYKEALSIRKKCFGEHDDSVASVLQHLGTIEFRASNLNKARDFLAGFLAIRRDNGSIHDVEFVNALLMMGNIHKQLEDGNNETEARVFWSEAYHVFHEDGLAETQPQIAEVIQHLVDEGKIDERTDSEMDMQTKKSFLLGMVSEKFKREKSDGLYQKGRKRRTGKGFKL